VWFDAPSVLKMLLPLPFQSLLLLIQFVKFVKFVVEKK